MPKIQKYGIKFPITVISEEKSLFDTNTYQSDSVKSELLHIIFTPKGQRLRDPEFGTNLIQYIFNPNDNQTWDDVVSEVKDATSKYLNHEARPVMQKHHFEWNPDTSLHLL